MKIVKLNIVDKMAIHFGDSQGNLKDIFSSDSLFSAIINNIASAYSEKNVSSVIQYIKNNEFRLSSLFYGFNILYNGDKKTFITVPKPKAPIFSENEIDKDIILRKKYKGIKYLSLNAYNKINKYWNDNTSQFNFDMDELIILGGIFGITENDLPFDIDDSFNDKIENCKIIKKSSRPRVQIDRLRNRTDNSSRNYYQQKDIEINRIRLSKCNKNIEINPFMYFLIKLNGNITPELQIGINLIKDNGLGGKRSQGMGLFNSIEISDFTRFNINNSNNYMSLSSCFPKKNELDKLLYYDLEVKNGYIYSLGKKPFRKKTVRTIKEGSIFTSDISGKIIDVSPEIYTDHPIWLNGRPLLIRIGDEI